MLCLWLCQWIFRLPSLILMPPLVLISPLVLIVLITACKSKWLCKIIECHSNSWWEKLIHIKWVTPVTSKARIKTNCWEDRSSPLLIDKYRMDMTVYNHRQYTISPIRLSYISHNLNSGLREDSLPLAVRSVVVLVPLSQGGKVKTEISKNSYWILKHLICVWIILPHTKQWSTMLFLQARLPFKNILLKYKQKNILCPQNESFTSFSSVFSHLIFTARHILRI